MKQENDIIGKPLDRVDGRLKVTGAARYSADMPIENVVYAALITSTIGKGRIQQMDIQEAQRAPGVLAVLTPFNAPRMAKGSIAAQSANQQASAAPASDLRLHLAFPTPRTTVEEEREEALSDPYVPEGAPNEVGAMLVIPWHDKSKPQAAKGGGEGGGQQAKRPPDRKIHLLQEDTVFYNNQPIGLVVADTWERAVYAASLVRVHYHEDKPATQLEREARHAYKPNAVGGPQDPPDSLKGSAEEGWQSATGRLDADYTTPPQTHNAMEPHATIAVWEGDHLTLYDATQGVFSDRKRVAALFEIPADNVRVVSKFVGGGFGSKGPVWSHVVLAAMAARQIGRPVKLVLSREQMFGPVGFRGEVRQKVRLGAAQDGALTLVQDDVLDETSMFDEFVENAGIPARMLYASPNIATTHRVARLNIGTPSYTRAPGECPGVYALESAMDELAYRMNMDPIAFRLKSYAEVDPGNDKPWSSKSLRECYQQGAERFGWSKRAPQPRSMRDGNVMIGYGMASATYPTNRSKASALARLLADGTALVQSGTQDIGTGTYTIMTQVAAQALGLPPEKVRFELGDTRLPETPVSGGSQTAASTGSAVLLAAQALRSKITQLAIGATASPLHGANEADIEAQNGRLFLKSDTSRGETYTAILARQGVPSVEARADAAPGDEKQHYSMHAFGAHFAEVRVDLDLGQVRVARYLGVFGAGRILNAKTARNQLMGGITMGIGLALMEQTLMNPRWGRVINADLADYYVPVNADIPNIDVIFVDEQDTHVNPLGVKGVGEIGIVGAPAAIANAVYHATGKRIRDLPITVEKLL